MELKRVLNKLDYYIPQKLQGLTPTNLLKIKWYAIFNPRLFEQIVINTYFSNRFIFSLKEWILKRKTWGREVCNKNKYKCKLFC